MVGTTTGSNVSDDMDSGHSAACDFMDADSDFIMPEHFDADSAMGDILPSYPYFPDLFPDSAINLPSSDNSSEFTTNGRMPFDGSDKNSSAEIALTRDCSCHDMLRTYEMVQVCLVWMPQCSSAPPGGRGGGPINVGTDDMLRCQKEVLETCRSRLQCRTCTFNSHDAMFIISICEKLLASILRVKCAYDDGAQEHDGVQQQQQTRRPGSSARKRSFHVDAASLSNSVIEPFLFSKQEPAITRAGGGGGGGGGGQTSSSSRPRTGTHRSNQSLDFGNGEWRIDDEDKLHVLQSLLNIRTSKLKDLISELEDIVTPRRWLVHITMIRDLVERIARDKSLGTP